MTNEFVFSAALRVRLRAAAEATWVMQKVRTCLLIKLTLQLLCFTFYATLYRPARNQNRLSYVYYSFLFRNSRTIYSLITCV